MMKKKTQLRKTVWLSLGLSIMMIFSNIVTPFAPTAKAQFTPPLFSFQFGTTGSSNGKFNHPYGIAVDGDRNIYVADVNNNRIQKFNSAGVYQSQFGSSGAGNGKFNHPYGIATDTEGNIYVADTNNNRIQKFNAAGVYLSQFDSRKQMSHPYGIAVDTSGNMYVADTGNNRIQKFNSSGVFIGAIGNVKKTSNTSTCPESGPTTGWCTGGTFASGAGNGELSHPYGIAVDASGNMYVADTNNNRIQIFNSAGKYVSQFNNNGQFSHPNGIALDAAGNIYVADTDNNHIEIFNSAGTYLTSLGSQRTGEGEFIHPSGVAVDAEGNIYVSDTNNNRIKVFGPLGPAGQSPGAITDLEATSGNGQITLTWTAPPDNGNPITDYIIEYYDGTWHAFNDGISTTTSVTITGLTNFTTYTFRVYAVNSNGSSSESNHVDATPNPCGALRDNDETNTSPLTTVSDSCIAATITSGGLSISYHPHSFFFPRKFLSTTDQYTFSNDNPATNGIVDVTTGPEDILTITDLSGTGGFTVDLTTSTHQLTSAAGNTIPTSNIFVITTAPSEASLNTLFAPATWSWTTDTDDGIVYSTGSIGQDITSATATSEDLKLTATYATSMDANNDGDPDIVQLMSAPDTEHILQASQALSFLLRIPGDQTAGTYSVQFTITASPN